jgi:RsiW-degrading membrane proteinase PrsW (M82 family)
MVSTKPQECVVPIHRPRNREIVFFFFCGVIMSISITFFISALLAAPLVGLPALLAEIIFVAVFPGFIEEFSKIFPLYYRHGETQRSILNLAIMVGLGFAIVELLEYVLFFDASIIVRIPGLFFHPATTAISAYGIVTRRPIPFYLLAAALHFSTNFLGIVSPFPFSLQFLVIALTIYLGYTFYSRTKEKPIAWSP